MEVHSAGLAICLGWIEIVEDSFAVISETFGRMSFWILEGSLALVMLLFAYAALTWPGPVSSFYRIVTATTILVATAIVEYFIARVLR